MNIRLEHANLVVKDLPETIRFLQTAFPEFRVRQQQEGPRPWAHVGTDDTYIAISKASKNNTDTRKPYSGSPGFNHLGYEVDDVEAVRQRLLSAGYQESTIPNNHPHRKRVYFYDPDGNDWEFVEYFSDVTELRNDYQIKD